MTFITVCMKSSHLLADQLREVKEQMKTEIEKGVCITQFC